MRRRVLALLAALASILPGCSTPIVGTDGGGRTCGTDLDCPASSYCGAGSACRTDCVVDTDCDLGFEPGATCDARGRCLGTPLPDAGPSDAGSIPDDARDPFDGGGPVVATWEAALPATASEADDRFGWSVAISRDGTRALVGAPYDDTAGGSTAGSARVFVRAGTVWTEEAILVAPDGAASDVFGSSVALSSDGSRALVGAPGDTTSGGAIAGSARVFLRTGTTWAQQATLLAPDGAANDGFGASVALSADGSRALVGVPYDEPTGGSAGDNVGSARVFLRSATTWAEEATLAAFPTGAQLGTAVALSADGSRALFTGPGGGVQVVFVRAGTVWTQEARLMPTLGAISVALSDAGDVALVGAWGEDTAAGSQAGAAHLFVRTGSAWSEAHMFVSPAPAATRWFGFSVALSADGRRALIGESPDERTPLVGAAYVFVGSGATWTDAEVLVAPDTMSGDRFGYAVALSGSGTQAIVGASYDEAGAGSAHAFTLSP